MGQLKGCVEFLDGIREIDTAGVDRREGGGGLESDCTGTRVFVDQNQGKHHCTVEKILEEETKKMKGGRSKKRTRGKRGDIP